MIKQQKKSSKNQIFNKQLFHIALVITVSMIALASGGYYGYKYVGERKEKTKIEASQPLKENSVGYSGKELKPKTTFGLFPWSIVIPDGWKVDKIGSLGIVFADEVSYQPGTPFKFVEPAEGKDVYRFSVHYEGTEDTPKEYESYTKTEYSNGQLSGYHYYHKFSAGEKYGSYVMQGGEKDYTYFLVDGDTTWIVSYLVLSGDKDQHDLIEEVVRSIRVQPGPMDESDL